MLEKLWSHPKDPNIHVLLYEKTGDTSGMYKIIFQVRV